MEIFWMIAFLAAMVWALYINNSWYKESLKIIDEWEKVCEEQNSSWYEHCCKQNEGWADYCSDIIKKYEVKDGIQKGTQGNLSGG